MLEQFASGQILYQRQVCLKKIVSWQVFGLGPSNIAEDAVLDFPLVLAHDEKAQFDHRPVGILMLNPFHFVADGGEDSEFFFQFAAKRSAGLLSFFDFSARKFPLQRHSLMTRPLADQQLAVSYDQARHYALHERVTAAVCKVLAKMVAQVELVRAQFVVVMQ